MYLNTRSQFSLKLKFIQNKLYLFKCCCHCKHRIALIVPLHLTNSQSFRFHLTNCRLQELLEPSFSSNFLKEEIDFPTFLSNWPIHDQAENMCRDLSNPADVSGIQFPFLMSPFDWSMHRSSC